jgi:hypothetical protein
MRGYLNSTAVHFGGHLYVTNEIDEEYVLEKWKLNE